MLAVHFLQAPYADLLRFGAQAYFSVTRSELRLDSGHERILFRSHRAPSFEADLMARPIYSNAPFFWALLLAVPWAAGGRLRAYVVGGSLLYFSHVAFLVTKIEVSLITVSHPSAGNPFIWGVSDDFFEITGKGFLPVVIWLGLGLQPLLGKDGRRRRIAGQPAPGRNAPCSCGSGKKFKKCCAL